MAAPKKKAAAKKAKVSRLPIGEETCVLGPYDAEPYALPEGIDMETHVIATYYTAWPKELNIVALSPVLAIEQSTGTWTPVPGETPEVRARHVAKVIGVYEAPEFEYIVPDDVKERQYIISLIHISEPTRLGMISYAVFCLKK